MSTPTMQQKKTLNQVAAKAKRFALGLHSSKWINFAHLKRMAVRQTSEVIARSDVPQHDPARGIIVPPDLRDTRARFFGTNGHSGVAGRLHILDLLWGGPTPSIPLLIALIPMLAVLTIFPFGSIYNGAIYLTMAFIAWVLARLTSISRMLFVVGLGAVFPLGANTFFESKGFSTMQIAVQSLMDVASGGQASLMALAGLLVPIIITMVIVGLTSSSGTARENMRVAMVYLLYAAVAIGVFFILGRIIPGFTKLGPWAIACGLPTLIPYLDWRQHANELVVMGRLFNIEQSGPTAQEHRKARKSQAEAAAKDHSPIVVLGTATGLATRKMDGFAPDSGLPVVVSLGDLSTHAIVTGQTGSGKTSAVFNQIAWQLLGQPQSALSKAIGALFMDGKGSMPDNFEGCIENYTVIRPGVPLGLLEGLSASEAVDAIFTGPSSGASLDGSSSSESSQFFQNAGRDMMLNFGVLIESIIALGVDERLNVPTRVRTLAKQTELAWCFDDWRRVMRYATWVPTKQHPDNLDPRLKDLLQLAGHHPDAKEPKSMLGGAMGYLLDELGGKDPETRSNVFDTVSGLIAPIFHHPAIRPWALMTTGLDVTQALKGKRYGLSLPKATYQQAGSLVASLLKARVYNAAVRRGDMDKWPENSGETQCIVICDECQEIIGQPDLAIAPIARSLGISLVYGCQTTEQIYARCGGETEGNGFLGQFLTSITLMSTQLTLMWSMMRVGETYVLHSGINTTGMDFRGTGRVVMSSPLFDKKHPNRPYYQHVARELGHKGLGALGVARAKQANQYVITPGTGWLALASQVDQIAFPEAVLQSQWEKRPLFDIAELHTHLADKFMALVQVNRGGIKRRDIVKLKPLHTIPKLKPQPVEESHHE